METKPSRPTALLLTVTGTLLLPWIVVLAAEAQGLTGWAWVVLDVAEAVFLLGAGRLLRAGHALHRPFAAAAALLLTADAWFDVRSAGHGSALLVAVAMAVLAEIPLAVLCTTLALRTTAARPATARPTTALPVTALPAVSAVPVTAVPALPMTAMLAVPALPMTAVLAPVGHRPAVALAA